MHGCPGVQVRYGRTIDIPARDVLNARAKTNGYKRGAHREEDSRRDCSKHKDGRQACYDGALGARGIHSLQSFGTSKPVYDYNAYTIESNYHGGTLKMYTTHPTESQNPNRRSEYHMNPLRGWLLTDSADSFRQSWGVSKRERLGKGVEKQAYIRRKR